MNDTAPDYRIVPTPAGYTRHCQPLMKYTIYRRDTDEVAGVRYSLSGACTLVRKLREADKTESEK